MQTTQPSCTFDLDNVAGFKIKMLNWLHRFGIFCYLDNRDYSFFPQQTDCLVAAGAGRVFTGTDLRQADAFFREVGWAFGHLSYELGHAWHRLQSAKTDAIGFPLIHFFSPELLLEINGNVLTVWANDPEATFTAIQQEASFIPHTSSSVPQAVLTKQQYLQTVRDLQGHIHRGDCYEINFCQEFVAEAAMCNPFAVFQKLMAVSPNPFSAFYRLHDKFLLCASPERFLLKRDNHLVSQPIKGTAKRDLSSTVADDTLRQSLQLSAKEQAENVMIVDLVRNDLTRICQEATVRVDELFGVYSFPQVHQLISTVSGELKDGVSFAEIIQATFPMGSMTGAPKHRVMQLIDQYEPAARGLFSGAVGYVKPGGNFDFNVVIRSLFYNETKMRLSYQVGSAITAYSNAEMEWEECLLKAEGLREALR